MDIFKQRRNLVITVGILIILNLGLLFLLWNNSFSPQQNAETRISHEERRTELKKILKSELDFSDEQVEKYLRVRFEHQNRIERIRPRISQIKREMFDEVLRENSQPAISDSMLSHVMELQSEIERMTYKHFVELKNICNPDQREKLKYIMHKILGPPRNEMRGNHPPQRDGRLHPPPGKN